jgi:XTP/dITP diphosphohydrolase
MKIVLATGNSGKVREIKEILSDYDVIAYTDLIEPKEIIEDGNSYQANAIIKSEAIYKIIDDKNIMVISDDSGISVDELGGEPNIYSARYAREGASDRENLELLIANLKKAGVTSSKAHYSACISITTDSGTFTTHGWMHGRVINDIRGNNGFGYDPCFIPDGFDKTLGELKKSTKKELSHRYKALTLAKKLIQILKKD